MVQPLVSRSGTHFERSAILDWLAAGSDQCPITKTALRPSDLVPDRRLEARLAFWRQENGVVLKNTLAEPNKVFFGIAALGERNIKSEAKAVRKGIFPRVFRANKVATVTA